MNTLKNLCAIIATVILVNPTTWAGDLTIPNAFTAGEKAKAADVNANFNAVSIAVNNNTSTISSLQKTVSDLQDTINKLQSSLNAVESNSVLSLDGNLDYVVDANGYATAQFTGINVQVVNGVSQETTNGLGNLIVGYNNTRSIGDAICSDGQYIDQVACEGAGETWTINHKSGSHNLVAGDENSYSQTGGVVFGKINSINRNYAGVIGGYANTARGTNSSVSGGSNNTASGGNSSVSGGDGNIASGFDSSISGGDRNIASGTFSGISGGYQNNASGDTSSVSGGFRNTASGDTSSISGGHLNTAIGDYSSVSGGSQGSAKGSYSSLSGGKLRSILGPHDWGGGNLFADQ